MKLKNRESVAISVLYSKARAIILTKRPNRVSSVICIYSLEIYKLRVRTRRKSTEGL